MEHSDTITLGTLFILGILGTSNFRALLELFFSVFDDELRILR